MIYNLIICGGTFDRLHEGHKAFLRFAFSSGKQVTIGVTSDDYVRVHKKNSNILPFVQRKEELESFLRKENFLQRAHIVGINSRFDETQVFEEVSVALLVSTETEIVGREINREREKRSLKPFPLLIFPLLKNQQGEKISSSKIRSGVITRAGILLPSKQFIAQVLYVPHLLREDLHRPFGIFFKDDIPQRYLLHANKMVTIGDVITKRIHQLGIQQKISVIDFRIERKKTDDNLSHLGFLGGETIEKVTNPSGQIVPEVWRKISRIIKNIENNKNTILVVSGEEDLLVIPLILMLPLGFILFYGQPALDTQQEKGVVMIEITEEVKRHTFDVIKQFVS